MRVRDVMSSPVVTVPPDMPLKAVAKLLVTRGVSAVPVWTAASWLPTRGAHLAPLPAALAAERGVPGVLEVRLDEEWRP